MSAVELTPIAPIDMPASFPVFRSGVVLESNLNLSVEQARNGASFLRERRNSFMVELLAALKSLGARDVEPGDLRENRQARPDIDERSVRFHDICFNYKRYRLEARVGFTLCEAERQSKVGVRVLCLEFDGQPARGLTTRQVGEFFHDARDVSDKLKDAAADGYERGVREYVAEHDDILTMEGEAAHNSFELNREYEFNTRAYDSSDQMAFAMIEELSDGDALSNILKRAEYRRVFRELWSVAYKDGDFDEADTDQALDDLRSDKAQQVNIVDGAYIDRSVERFDDQRGLFVSKIIEGEGDRPARIEYVGIMPDTLDPDENDPEQVRRSPAFRLTHQVFAKFANQF